MGAKIQNNKKSLSIEYFLLCLVFNIQTPCFYEFGRNVGRNVSQCLDYVNFNGVINSFSGTQLLIALSPPMLAPQKKVE